MLVAAAAAHGRRVWVTNEIADAVLRAHLHHTDVVPVIHPLTQLSTANRRAYRPEATLIDVEL